MIVRIATEGQYELHGDQVGELNRLDDAVTAACEAGDGVTFRSNYDAMLGFVRSRGTAIDPDRLSASDVIMPPPDVTLEEAQTEFTGDGLLPTP